MTLGGVPRVIVVIGYSVLLAKFQSCLFDVFNGDGLGFGLSGQFLDALSGLRSHEIGNIFKFGGGFGSPLEFIGEIKVRHRGFGRCCSGFYSKGTPEHRNRQKSGLASGAIAHGHIK